MSHVTAVDIEIQDLEALETACQELGITLVKGQTTFKWYGTWVADYHAEDAAYKHGVKPENYGKCEHAIQVPGSNYEVGVVPREEGGYTLVYDFYGTGQVIKRKLGSACEHLKHAYAKAVTVKEMEKLKAKGFHHHQTTKLANGKTQLIYRRG